MLFLESSARTLLILHAVAAAFLVAASTHQLLWCRGYLEGRYEKKRQERRIMPWVALAFVINFAGGAILYPTYKVRVRAEYFDAPQSVAAEATLRHDEAQRQGSPSPRVRPAELGWLGRLFDIKEHWVALGVFGVLALLALSRWAHPSEHPRYVVAYLGLSAAVCASAWIGAVVGLVVASFRAVGGAT